ncbi:hypothetical protein L6164_020323 [Bauhinia variegata]|uniref:Uncharacterized protein n=1 Tax=Bauhinia variegata TaxID=167791 RepID=A0ACB9MV10_BAUVA|nr:hypothetical protein L6164_020323 [Bauhinia variegata]
MKPFAPMLPPVWFICLQLILLFYVTMLWSHPGKAVSALGNETDYLALLKFKESISDDPFEILASWNSSTHFCNWHGITCNHQHQRVIELDLRSYHLLGFISPYVGNLSFLRSLLLQHNRLKGAVPQELDHLSQLQQLSLTNNTLSGQIPTNLTSCSELRRLNLSWNGFIGKIPSEIGLLRKLEMLTIVSNNLTGKIPDSIGNLSSLTIFHAAYNNLEGSIPDVSHLRNLTRIGVPGNKLVGTLFSSLYNMSSLILISAAENQFNGSLPDDIFLTLPNLQTFAIGSNHMVGPIPNSIMNISVLQQFDIGGNYFAGQVPRLGNLLDLTFLSLYSNNLGSGSFGSVYKASLEPEYGVVAIKVLNLQKKGANSTFIAECNALRNIRHRNLVKILTCCSSIDYEGNEFKALIFEYMENGSLEKWLHLGTESAISQKLSLVQRVNTIIDVSSALHYLHHECEQPIIHCDLKPENVLLDHDMVAHVGDFGLARLLSAINGIPYMQTSSIGIKGTLGYAPPEYGMNSDVSTQGDVYSYGILVLEMLTGRRPTDDMFKDGENLHSHVKTAYPDNLLQIVDPTIFHEELQQTATSAEGDKENLFLMPPDVEKIFVSLFRIGLGCSVESPKERMSMVNVIKELNLIRNVIPAGARRLRMQRLLE